MGGLWASMAGASEEAENGPNPREGESWEDEVKMEEFYSDAVKYWEVRASEEKERARGGRREGGREGGRAGEGEGVGKGSSAGCNEDLRQSSGGVYVCCSALQCRRFIVA